jgi:hypothetical protein
VNSIDVPIATTASGGSAIIDSTVGGTGTGVGVGGRGVGVGGRGVGVTVGGRGVGVTVGGRGVGVTVGGTGVLVAVAVGGPIGVGVNVHVGMVEIWAIDIGVVARFSASVRSSAVNAIPSRK